MEGIVNVSATESKSSILHLSHVLKQSMINTVNIYSDLKIEIIWPKNEFCAFSKCESKLNTIHHNFGDISIVVWGQWNTLKLY